LEKINRQVSLACRALCDGEKATVTVLCDRAEAALASIAGIIPECDGLIERLGALRAEAEDIADLVREFGDEDVGDPTAELDKLEGRLEVISRLGRKYGEGVEAILAFREEAAARLVVIDTADERIADLEQEEEGLRKRLAHRADELTAIRKTKSTEKEIDVREFIKRYDLRREGEAIVLDAVLDAAEGRVLSPEVLVSALRTHAGILSGDPMAERYRVLRRRLFLSDAETEFR
jgi:DNA repair ATPase RecN